MLDHVRALEAEVNTLRALRHPNIVRYLGVETDGEARPPAPASLQLLLVPLLQPPLRRHIPPPQTNKPEPLKRPSLSPQKTTTLNPDSTPAGHHKHLS